MKQYTTFCHVSPLLSLYELFFSIQVFFHDHSRITALQGKRGWGISLTPHYYFHPLHKFRYQLGDYCRELPLHIAGSWTRTGNFWVLSANHQATCPLYEPLNNKITSVKHVCHFGLIVLTCPPSLCAYFMDASSCLADFTLPLYFLVSCH